MTDDLKATIRSYFEGSMPLAELEETIDRVVNSKSVADTLLDELDKEFASGRLPTQLYQSLRDRVRQAGQEPEPQPSPPDLEPTVSPALEPTVSPVSERQLEKTLLAESPQLESTIRVADEQEVAPRPVDEPDPSPPEISDPTIAAAEPDATAGPAIPDPTVAPIAPDPTAGPAIPNPAEAPPEATMTSSIPGRPGVVRTEVISPPPAPVSDTPLDFELPSQPSRATGSNWANPEQWTETQQGPIGPGSIIAKRYIIESQLGKGGMGIVFKARDRMKEEAQDTNPFIAIKVLNGDFREHPKSLIALQREATKAQKLAHPNIVTVYDFSRDGTTVYMTMELMRGDSLADRIRTMRHGGLSPEEARPLIMEMAVGLAYAHERDIVHSDFKPGNVFLMRDGRVKLLDFGIARAAQDAEDAATENAIFDAGDLGAMTPTYASLEMLEGDPPHPADDVYALAVSAYTLLTGEHPFNRLTAKEAFEKRLKPKPIKGLKRREWRAIEQGLAFVREERLQDAGQFYRRFRGATRITKTAAAAIVILALSASYFAYESFQEPPPPFPWEELSPADQTAFTEYIDEGQFYLDNDPPFIGGAFDGFARAYDLHPRNPEATKGLRAVADMLIDVADTQETTIQKKRLLDDLKVVSEHEYLEEDEDLRELREQLATEFYDL